MERPLDPPEEDEVKEAEIAEKSHEILLDLIEREIDDFGDYAQSAIFSDGNVFESLSTIVRNKVFTSVSLMDGADAILRAVHVNLFLKFLRDALAKTPDLINEANERARKLYE